MQDQRTCRPNVGQYKTKCRPNVCPMQTNVGHQLCNLFHRHIIPPFRNYRHEIDCKELSISIFGLTCLQHLHKGSRQFIICLHNLHAHKQPVYTTSACTENLQKFLKQPHILILELKDSVIRFLFIYLNFNVKIFSFKCYLQTFPQWSADALIFGTYERWYPKFLAKL